MLKCLKSNNNKKFKLVNKQNFHRKEKERQDAVSWLNEQSFAHELKTLIITPALSILSILHTRL